MVPGSFSHFTTWVQINVHLACMLLEGLALVLLRNHLVVLVAGALDLLAGHVLCDLVTLGWHAVASLAALFLTSTTLRWLQKALVGLTRSTRFVLLFLVDLLPTLVGSCILLLIHGLLHLLFLFQLFQLLFNALLIRNLFLKPCDLLTLLSLCLQLSLVLHGTRFLNLLLNLLDSFELGSAASRTLTSDKPAYSRRVFNEAWNHELFSLFFETVDKHIIYVGWRQFRWWSIQTIVQV